MAKGSNGIKYTGGLKREYHHVKVTTGDGQEDYEPCMILLREERQGRSFAIPLSCLWKYLEPGDNKDMRKVDQQEFDRMARKVYAKRQFSINPATTAKDCAAIVLAEQANETSGIMLCTAYGLVKACQVLDITVCAQSIVQVLMFIQDGLDDLRKMPDHQEEESVEAGEVIIEVNGKKHHHEVRLSESDLVYGGE
jgi:hypothetical protein